MRLHDVRTALVILVLALLVGTRVDAQTHPCDTPPASPGSGTVTVGQQYTLGWCQPALDDGATFREYRSDGTMTNLVPVSGTANAAGEREYFVSSRVEKTIGKLSIELTARNAAGVESARSAPFSLIVNPRTPAAPRILGVRTP